MTEGTSVMPCDVSAIIGKLLMTYPQQARKGHKTRRFVGGTHQVHDALLEDERRKIGRRLRRGVALKARYNLMRYDSCLLKGIRFSPEH